MSVACTADKDRADPLFPLKVVLVMVTAQLLGVLLAEMLVLLLPVHVTATGCQLLMNDVRLMFSMPENAPETFRQDAPWKEGEKVDLYVMLRTALKHCCNS